MKTTRDKIQALNKAGRILSRIFFILSAVGIALSILYMLFVYSGRGVGDRIERVLSKYDCTREAIYPVLLTVIITLIGELFLSHKAENYFLLSLEQGTPFTLAVAKKLFSLGIYSIVTPLTTYAVSFLILFLSPSISTDMLKTEFHFSLSISLGIIFIIISLLLKLGSEEKGGNND